MFVTGNNFIRYKPSPDFMPDFYQTKLEPCLFIVDTTDGNIAQQYDIFGDIRSSLLCRCGNHVIFYAKGEYGDTGIIYYYDIIAKKSLYSLEVKNMHAVVPGEDERAIYFTDGQLKKWQLDNTMNLSAVTAGKT